MGLMTYDGYASPRSTAAFVASEAFLGHGASERSLLDGAGWETARNYALFGVAAQQFKNLTGQEREASLLSTQACEIRPVVLVCRALEDSARTSSSLFEFLEDASRHPPLN